MNWNTLASTLLGALITYSAILLTQAIELWKRKRAHESLIRALLQALHEELETLLEMARMNAPSIEDLADGKPYEQLFTANQDYFTVYHANTALIMQIKQVELRRCIFETYMRAKSPIGHRDDEPPLSGALPLPAEHFSQNERSFSAIYLGELSPDADPDRGSTQKSRQGV